MLPDAEATITKLSHENSLRRRRFVTVQSAMRCCVFKDGVVTILNEEPRRTGQSTSLRGKPADAMPKPLHT